MGAHNLFLAIDLGTSGVKVGAFDVQGRLMANATERYRVIRPQPEWAEQEPGTWWDACRRAVREVASQIEGAQLQAIGVTGLAPALVCVDERGEAVRPAPIWSDLRAVAEIAELSERLGYDTNFSLLPRFLWMKRHEPDSYRQTRWMFQPFEYISFKLTGDAASIAASEQLPPWSAQDIEASELDPEKLPPRLCTLGDIVGSLTPDVAAQTGLPSGLPVVAGTVDSFVAWIGTATTRKGVLCNTVGTSDGIALVWDQPLGDPQRRLQTLPHIIGRDWIVGGAMSSGGLMLDWFVRRFYQHVSNPFEIVEQEAGSVPAGAEGLIALPYLIGERSPIFDPHARGVFFGIAETHTRAHFARAVLESVAFAVRHVCETILEIGAHVEEVRLAGRAAHNRTWSQIKADVLGRKVHIPEIADSSLLGAAIIASWGVGQFEDLAEAAQMMVKFRTVLEPSPEQHALYGQLFEFYKELYAHLKDDFARMFELQSRFPPSTSKRD